MSSFVERVEGISGLANLVPDSDISTTPRYISVLESEVKHLSTDQAALLRTKLRELGESLRSAADDIDEPMGGQEPGELDDRRRIVNLDDDPEVAAIFFHMLSRVRLGIGKTPTSDLLRRSCLLLLVSGLELLVSDVCRHVLRCAPTLIDFKQPRVSLESAQALGTFKEILEDAIHHEVDAVMRGGIEDWARWLSRSKIQIREIIDNDWPALLEVTLRRNAHVHTDGKVNRAYRLALSRLASDAPSVGASLPVDREYLRSASDSVLAGGVLLCHFAGIQLHPREASWILQSLASLVSVFVDTDQPWPARRICERTLRLSTIPEEVRISLMVSNWVAAREIGESEIVRDEIESWDISNLGPEVGHQKFVLLRDIPRSIDAVGKLVRSRELTAVTLRNRVLYRPMLPDLLSAYPSPSGSAGSDA